jgi:hypothetical protein
MIGRGERIRTSDSCVPNAVLYQAELHPEADGGSCYAQHPFVKNYREKLKQRGQKLRSTAKAANCSKADLEFESGKQEIAALAICVSC